MKKALYSVVTLMVGVVVFGIYYTAKHASIGPIILVVLALIIFIWLFRRYGRRVGYAGRAVRSIRPGWVIIILLLIGYGIFIYYNYPWKEKMEELSAEEIREIRKNPCIWEIPDEVSDNTYVISLKVGCPAIIKMKRNQMMVWWGNEKKFRTGWFYDERAPRNGKFVDKFRVFQPVRDEDSVELKIHRYYDPDPLWYKRQ